MVTVNSTQFGVDYEWKFKKLYNNIFLEKEFLGLKNFEPFFIIKSTGDVHAVDELSAGGREVIMLYLQIVLSIVASLVGLFKIYNKKILKKDYNQDSLILFILVIFYSKDSQSQIVQWLLFVVALIIIFIMLDKLYSKINIKRWHFN